MRIDVVTLFPDMIAHAARYGVTGRAAERGLWQLGLWNPRDFTVDPHRTVDDRPYGGGPGMVMMAQPLSLALRAARSAQAGAGARGSVTIHLSPAGEPLTHRRVADLAAADGVGYVLLATRYEGVDERLVDSEIDLEMSVGDFVVSGGELPALVLIDAIVRQLPGALNDAASAEQDSFASGLLDCPHYTRPEDLDGVRVPQVLLSGDHAAIARWRREHAFRRTFLRRPDLLAGRAFTTEEQAWLAALMREHSPESSRSSGASGQPRIAHDQGAPCSRAQGQSADTKRKETQ